MARFVKYDNETGAILEWGDAGEEHLEAAHDRGDSLILLKTEDPYVFDGLKVDLNSLRLVEKKPDDA